MKLYAVAYRADTGVIIPLTQSTAVLKFAYADLERYKADARIAGDNPDRFFVAWVDPEWRPVE